MSKQRKDIYEQFKEYASMDEEREGATSLRGVQWTVPESGESEEVNEKQQAIYAKLKQYASEDAKRDGVGSAFQSFQARLTELARSITEHIVTDSIKGFRAWANGTREKLNILAGSIPENPETLIRDIETQTEGNSTKAEKLYRKRIIQLEKDKILWEKRFGPALASNLEEPAKKNAFLTFGLILILLAIESILNSIFFLKTSSGIDAIGKTLGISLGNILIPLGLAFLGHLWSHRHDSLRGLGIAMVALFLVWGIGFNAMAVYIRISEAAEPAAIDMMHGMLLFAVGAAVAGVSFWKGWSYFDPFKRVRKCINDLNSSQKEFEKMSCIALIEEKNKYNFISSVIRAMEKESAGRFRYDEANFSRLHNMAVDSTNRIFDAYYQEYCPMKVDPDPERPLITSENTVKYNVGIKDSEREFFNEIKKQINDEVGTAVSEWIPKLHDILGKISDLTKRFQDVALAKLLEWEKEADTS